MGKYSRSHSTQALFCSARHELRWQRNVYLKPPDSDRIAINRGNGPPDLDRTGRNRGTAKNTMTVQNLPAHTHTVPGSPPTSTGVTGGSQPFDNRQPFVALSFDIELEGPFPSQGLDASDPEDGGAAGVGFTSGNEIIDEAAARELIEPIFLKGIELWKAAGISDAQAAKLNSASFTIADLGTGRLAYAGENNVITIDRDASNRGWFVDTTPSDNVEFGSTDPVTGNCSRPTAHPSATTISSLRVSMKRVISSAWTTSISLEESCMAAWVQATEFFRRAPISINPIRRPPAPIF